MKNYLKHFVAAALVLTPGCIIAQTATVKVPMCLQVREGTKSYIPCTGIVPVDTETGNALSWQDLFGSISGGGSGTGISVTAGSVSSRANPVQNADGTKIASEIQMGNAVNQLTTVVNRLNTLTTNLGTPVQAGGSVGISGTLPAFAATPTVNIGTMPTQTVTLPAGIATTAKQDATIAVLGSPFQVGGTIGNTAFGARLQDSTGAAFGTSANPIYVTGSVSGGGSGGGTPTGAAGTPNTAVVSVQGIASGTPLVVTNTAPIAAGTNAIGSITNSAFGISGTLPAFAATPTFNIGTAPLLTVGGAVTANIGTLGGVATAANQSTLNASVGAPADAAATTTDTTATSLIAQTKQLVNRVNALITNMGTPFQANGISSNVVQSASTDRGASVGTTAVSLMAANANRKGFSVQVQSQTASCYINGSGTATADFHSLLVGPGGYFEPDHHVNTSAISIICTEVATPVFAREW